jgi:PAS domain S-box-containing protein
MPKNLRYFLMRYGCAAASVAAATWFRLLLDPALGNQFPFATVLFAILLTAWYGGFFPALIAVVLGALSAKYFILPPRGSFVFEGSEQQGGLVLFCSTGLSIALLGGAMHIAIRKAEANAEAERRQAVLLDQSYDAVLVWQWNGPITFWNSGAERLYGFNRAEAVGQVSHGLLRTKRPGGVNVFVSALEQDGKWEGELDHTTRDGQRIIVETRMVLAREGGRSYVLEANRDITARRRMEEQLREANTRLESLVRERTAELAQINESLQVSEERFRLLVEGAREYANFMLDTAGRIMTWNSGAERSKGYAADEIIGRHFSCFYPEEDVARGKPEQELQEALATGQCTDEGWRVRKDGSRFWARVVITPLHDKSGGLRGFAKVTRDITESMRAQERFRQAVESAPNGMVMIDAEGKIVLVNAQTERLFGYTRDEILGQPVELLVPQRFRPKHPEYRSGFFANPQVRPMGAARELYARRKDGSEFPVEIGLNPIKTDDGVMVLSAIVDITQRKRAEERFRQAVESAPNGMVMIDPKGTITLVNAQTEKLFGYGREELLGQPVELLVPERFRAKHPEYRSGFFANPQVRSMGVGRDLFGRRKDGSEFPVEIGLNPIKTDEGLMVLSAIVDITERKRAEEALRAERDWFVKIVSTVPVVICSYRQRPDGSAYFLFADPRIEQIYGFTLEELGKDALPIFTRMHPDDVGGVVSTLEAAGKALIPWRGEFRVRHPSRAEIWVEGHVIPTLEPDGCILWQGYIADVTERKQAEQALRDRERLLRIVTGSARVGLVVVGVGYRYLFANEAYAEIFGLASHELVGQRVSDVLAAGWSQIQPRLDRALAGEQVSYELTLPTLSGAHLARTFTVVYQPRTADDGEPTVVVVVVDISERKRAEDALRDSEQRLRLFIEYAPAALAMFDDKMRYLAASRRWMADYSFSGDDLTGQSHYDVFPEVPESWKLVHRRGLAGEIVQADEDRFVRADGSVQWLRWEVRPWLRTDGTIGGIVIFTADITDRKVAKEALQRLNAELERGVQQLTEANRELKARTQENEAFVYTVSHDLRSPLVNLQGFTKELARAALDLHAHLTQSELPQPIRDRELAILDGPVAKSIRFIQNAVTRLSNIIDALLRLSRAGRVVYQRQKVDVQAIVARVVDSLKITSQERNAVIQVGELPPALGDPSALEQIFANLIGNALNYLAPGRPGHIQVGCLPPAKDNSTADMRTYFVRDNGQGIMEASKAKVFQPFQRLHPQAAPGEGMGLAIVQRVIERHGGKIWFESTAGQGTTFFVTLLSWPDDQSPGTSVDSTSSESRNPP